MAGKARVHVNVTYCGAWGYASKFRKLVTELEQRYSGDAALEITGTSTPNRTGKFEVEVNGKLVHSKLGGAGFVDSKEKLNVIMLVVDMALEEAEKAADAGDTGTKVAANGIPKR